MKTEGSSVPDDDDDGEEVSLLGWLVSIDCWYPKNAVGGSKVDNTARESSESNDQVSALKIVYRKLFKRSSNSEKTGEQVRTEMSNFVKALRGFFNKNCMLGPS